jgi:hypothetical protein
VTVPLDEDGARKVFKLIDALEDCDDVQNVYSNLDVSDEIMELLDACWQAIHRSAVRPPARQGRRPLPVRRPTPADGMQVTRISLRDGSVSDRAGVASILVTSHKRIDSGPFGVGGRPLEA